MFFFEDVSEGPPGRFAVGISGMWESSCNVQRGSQLPWIALNVGGKVNVKSYGFAGLASPSEGSGKTIPSSDVAAFLSVAFPHTRR